MLRPAEGIRYAFELAYPLEENVAYSVSPFELVQARRVSLFDLRRSHGVCNRLQRLIQSHEPESGTQPAFECS
jgi:hypothetical protein